MYIGRYIGVIVLLVKQTPGILIKMFVVYLKSCSEEFVID